MIDELIQKQVEECDFNYIPHEEHCAFYEASNCDCDRPRTVKLVKAHLVRSMKKVGEEIEENVRLLFLYAYEAGLKDMKGNTIHPKGKDLPHNKKAKKLLDSLLSSLTEGK